MTEYRYTRTNPAATREFYMYSPYEGPSFIHSYMNDRNVTLAKLDTLLNLNKPSSECEHSVVEELKLANETAIVSKYRHKSRSNLEKSQKFRLFPIIGMFATFLSICCLDQYHTIQNCKTQQISLLASLNAKKASLSLTRKG